MTKEEAIKILKDCELNPCVPQDKEAVNLAIKALEKEPMLDKIRAEIIKYEGDCRLSVDEYPSCKQCTDNVFETIYGIIDKYKAESEK